MFTRATHLDLVSAIRHRANYGGTYSVLSKYFINCAMYLRSPSYLPLVVKKLNVLLRCFLEMILAISQ